MILVIFLFLLSCCQFSSLFSLSPASNSSEIIQVFLFDQTPNPFATQNLYRHIQRHRSFSSVHTNTPMLFLKRHNFVTFYKDDSLQKSGSFKFRGVDYQGRVFLAHYLADQIKSSQLSEKTPDFHLATPSTGNHGIALLNVLKELYNGHDQPLFDILEDLVPNLTEHQRTLCRQFFLNSFHVWVIASIHIRPEKIDAIQRGFEFSLTERPTHLPVINDCEILKLYQYKNLHVTLFDFKDYGEAGFYNISFIQYLNSLGHAQYVDHTGVDISAAHSTIADEIFDRFKQYEAFHQIPLPLPIVWCITAGAGGIISNFVRLKQLCLLEGLQRRSITVAVESDYCKYTENLYGLTIPGTHFPIYPFADGSAVNQPEALGLTWCRGHIDATIKIPESLSKHYWGHLTYQLRKAYQQQDAYSPDLTIKVGGTSAHAYLATHILLSHPELIGLNPDEPAFIGCLGCEGNIYPVSFPDTIDDFSIEAMINDLQQRTLVKPLSSLYSQNSIITFA